MANDALTKWKAELPGEGVGGSVTRLKDLARRVHDRKVQFLCGSGMSKASKLPLAEELAAAMVGEMVDADKRLASSLAKKHSVGAIAEAFLAEKDQPRLDRLIQTSLKLGTADKHEGHVALEYLASQNYIDKVYTTNFDDLLESTFGGRARRVIDKTADELPALLKQGLFPILYLHGTANAEYLLAESVTYRLDTPLAHFMMADMVTSWFVWVGYSLGDVDLRTIYFSMQGMLRKEKLAKRPFVVHPLDSEGAQNRNAEWNLADQVWNARRATYIPGRAELFLPALVEQVRRVGAEDMARKIVEKRGGNPDDDQEIDNLWEQAKIIARKTEQGNEVEAVEALADAEGVE